VRRILGVLLLGAIVAAGEGISPAEAATRSGPFGPVVARTVALRSVTVDTSLDAYPAGGGQLRGGATTVVDLAHGRASGFVEIQPETNFLWWRDARGVLVESLAVDIQDETATRSDPDPSWSPPAATRAATFALLSPLRDARHVRHTTGDRYEFILPMTRLNARLRAAMQATSPNLGDTFAGLGGHYITGTGTAYVARNRVVRVEYVFHGPNLRPSAAISWGLSRLGRSHPEAPPGPLTARPVD
jgi:hypothetical protein